jgi:hypothetical protein
MQKYRLVLVFFLSLFSIHSDAQCESIAEQCKQYMDALSSSLGGSVHQVLWLNDVMRLPITLRSGTHYYLASCRSPAVSLQYRILDDEQRIIFDGAAQNNAQYATFIAPSTANGHIEIALQSVLDKPICTAFAMGFAK